LRRCHAGDVDGPWLIWDAKREFGADDRYRANIVCYNLGDSDVDVGA
jgi:hypothetical protein